MLKQKDPIAVIGSPSDTLELTVDVLDSARDEGLVGSLLCLEASQDGQPLCVTGQVTGVSLSNRWHEQDIMRNIIKSRGAIPHLSGRQDVRTANLSIGTVFIRDRESEAWKSALLGSVPASGTPIRRLDQQLLDELLREQRDHLFYFGRAYGDENINLPMYLKHFGSPDEGGQGEAYHSLIVGKTGSGKSTLAKMMLAGYARHKGMAILVIDPKGEFSDEVSGFQVGDAGLPLEEIFKGQGRSARRYGITQVCLQSWDLFVELARSLSLHRTLNISRSENGAEFAQCLADAARDRGIKLIELHEHEHVVRILEDLLEEDTGYLARIYKSKDKREELAGEIQRAIGDERHRLYRVWNFLTFLFRDKVNNQPRPSIRKIVGSLLSEGRDGRPIIVLDLSVPGNRRDMEDLSEREGGLVDADQDGVDLFTDSLQKKIIYHIVSDLRRTAEQMVSERHRQGHKDNANTLVVFEEAHRYAPAQIDGDDREGKRLRARLIEAVRETRKFGLGWMFVDQTLGGIDKQITQQVRLAYFGYGLTMGSELERVRELVGGDRRDAALYQSFRDPAGYASSEDRRFPWMAVGPVSPMAANRPLFFNAFSGEEFTQVNDLATLPGTPSKPRAKKAKPPSISRHRSPQGQPSGLKDLPGSDFDFFNGG